MRTFAESISGEARILDVGTAVGVDTLFLAQRVFSLLGSRPGFLKHEL